MPRLIRTDVVEALAAAQRDGEVLAIYPPTLTGLLAADQAAIHPATERAAARRQGAVEIIPVRGLITNRSGLLELFGLATSTERLSRQITAAARDADVKAIVLDIDSPGGTVPGVDALADDIFALRGGKPIVAQVNGIAASAAYWIAASADEIVAPEASYTGSIGVLAMHIDVTGMLEQDGIKVSLIASSADKVEDQPFVALSAEARDYIQGRVDHFDRMFTASVARGRGVAASAIRAMAGRGRVYPGSQALERGLVDKVRTMAGTLAAYGVDVNALADRRQARGSARERMRREVDLLDR